MCLCACMSTLGFCLMKGLINRNPLYEGKVGAWIFTNFMVLDSLYSYGIEHIEET